MADALVLAHGAFHGPWCWSPTVEHVAANGVRCVAVDLNRGGLEPDRDALQEAVNGLRAEGHRVHAIGHSLGCCSVAALDPTTLATATLLAGPVANHPDLPDDRELIADGFIEHLQPQPDGRAILPRDFARNAFYHRCTEAEAEAALDQLRPTFVYGAVPTDPPFWERLPVTYVACRDDRAVRPAYQAAVAKRLPGSATLDWDHSPMIGHAEALAALIFEAMARADQA
ncbi:MAG: alpha/beta fold hydrolase [Myxococcota bacterium]